MKIYIDATNRDSRKIIIYDSAGSVVGSTEGESGVLELIHRALGSCGLKLSDVSEFEARMDGESRVGTLIGVSAANALSYILGLKGAQELRYPKDPESGLL